MKVPGPDPIPILSDPLSEVSRKERRNLMAASITYIVVMKLGLVPSKISALGIDLSAPAQDAFLGIFSLIVVYFLCAFSLYAIADLMVWKKRYEEYFDRDDVADIVNSNALKEDRSGRDNLHALGRHLTRLGRMYKYPSLVSIIRLAFEFLLPIMIGVYAISLYLV